MNATRNPVVAAVADASDEMMALDQASPNPAPVTTTAEDAQEVAAVRAPVAVATSDAERAALLPCPFCGASASGYGIDPHTHTLRLGDFQMPDHPGSYIIEGDCSCGSGLIGATQEEVTARWNTRTTPLALPIDFKQATDQGGVAEALAAAVEDLDAAYKAAMQGKPIDVSVGQFARLRRMRAMLPAAPTLLGVADGDAVAAPTLHTPGTRLSDLREAAHAGYMAACRDVYALVEETRKSSNIIDDFTRGRCFEAKGIARTMGALGTESDELRKALGEVMRAAIAKADGDAVGGKSGGAA